MKSIMPYLLVVAFVFNSAFLCQKERRPSSCHECPTDIMCTMEYRTIGVTVKDTLGNPYALDAYRTKQLSTGAIYDLQISSSAWEDSVRKAQGHYPVLTDSYTHINRCGEDFEFLGYKNSALVVSQILNIKSDCCHINLVSGNTEVTVNQ